MNSTRLFPGFNAALALRSAGLMLGLGLALAGVPALGQDVYPPITVPIGTQSTSASRYAIAWTNWSSTLSNSHASMPLGNGDVALNVWAEQGGDLLFYISKTDAWDDYARLCKVGRVRIRFWPNPFAAGQPFQQTLDPERGEIIFAAGTGTNQAQVKVWVDANRPVIHVEKTSGVPGQMQAAVEVYRNQTVQVTETTSDIYDGNSSVNTYSLPDTVVAGQTNRVTWYHWNTNNVSPWLDTFNLQHIPNPAALGFVDPWTNRIFGALIEGAGFTNNASTNLVSATLDTNQDIAIHVLTDPMSSPAVWLSKIGSNRVAADGVALPAAYAQHLDWWAQFWSRSWIHLGSSNELSTVSSMARGYALQRFIIACAGRGA